MDNILCIEKIRLWEELLQLVPERDRLSAAALEPIARREEFLMWRSIVYRYLPDAEIDYNGVGAPVISNYPVCLGVSHCPGYVAVCLSNLPCAVDIELLNRNFERAAARFATVEERQLSDSSLLLAALWGGKEALYKYSGCRELDLLRDLRIETFDPAAGRMTGSICGGQPIEVGFRVENGLFVAFIF